MNATQKQLITRSKENYLRTIYELSKLNKLIRSSDIAEKLGVSRASVSKMMSELKKAGLIEKEKYGGVTLTEGGYKISSQIKMKHDLIKVFLMEVLGVREPIADRDACNIEHCIGSETIEKLNKQLERAFKYK